MRKYFIFTLFLIGVVVFCCVVVRLTEAQQHKNHHQVAESENIILSGKIENGIRIIEIKASRYSFEPDSIAVNFGEKVRLVVTSTDATHGFSIPELKVNLSVPMGKTESIEFVADKKGSFHAHCSVYCGLGHEDMHANFIVK